MTPQEQVRDAAVRASMRRHPAGKGRQPPPCNDCGDPATVQHRTGTSNGQAFYIWLCDACHHECNQEWNRKGVHR